MVPPVVAANVLNASACITTQGTLGSHHTQMRTQDDTDTTQINRMIPLYR